MKNDYTLLVTLDKNLEEMLKKESKNIPELLEKAICFLQLEEFSPDLQISATVEKRCSLSKNNYFLLNELAKIQGDYVNLLAGKLIFEFYLRSISYDNTKD